jgi:hypothetical protein
MRHMGFDSFMDALVVLNLTLQPDVALGAIHDLLTTAGVAAEDLPTQARVDWFRNTIPGRATPGFGPAVNTARYTAGKMYRIGDTDEHGTLYDHRGEPRHFSSGSGAGGRVRQQQAHPPAARHQSGIPQRPLSPVAWPTLSTVGKGGGRGGMSGGNPCRAIARPIGVGKTGDREAQAPGRHVSARPAAAASGTEAGNAAVSSGGSSRDSRCDARVDSSEADAAVALATEAAAQAALVASSEAAAAAAMATEAAAQAALVAEHLASQASQLLTLRGMVTAGVLLPPPRTATPPPTDVLYMRTGALRRRIFETGGRGNCFYSSLETCLRHLLLGRECDAGHLHHSFLRLLAGGGMLACSVELGHKPSDDAVRWQEWVTRCLGTASLGTMIDGSEPASILATIFNVTIRVLRSVGEADFAPRSDLVAPLAAYLLRHAPSLLVELRPWLNPAMYGATPVPDPTVVILVNPSRPSDPSIDAEYANMPPGAAQVGCHFQATLPLPPLDEAVEPWSRGVLTIIANCVEPLSSPDVLLAWRDLLLPLDVASLLADVTSDVPAPAATASKRRKHRKRAQRQLGKELMALGLSPTLRGRDAQLLRGAREDGEIDESLAGAITGVHDDAAGEAPPTDGAASGGTDGSANSAPADAAAATAAAARSRVEQHDDRATQRRRQRALNAARVAAACAPMTPPAPAAPSGEGGGPSTAATAAGVDTDDDVPPLVDCSDSDSSLDDGALLSHADKTLVEAAGHVAAAALTRSSADAVKDNDTSEYSDSGDSGDDDACIAESPPTEPLQRADATAGAEAAVGSGDCTGDGSSGCADARGGVSNADNDAYSGTEAAGAAPTVAAAADSGAADGADAPTTPATTVVSGMGSPHHSRRSNRRSGGDSSCDAGSGAGEDARGCSPLVTPAAAVTSGLRSRGGSARRRKAGRGGDSSGGSCTGRGAAASGGATSTGGDWSGGGRSDGDRSDGGGSDGGGSDGGGSDDATAPPPQHCPGARHVQRRVSSSAERLHRQYPRALLRAYPRHYYYCYYHAVHTQHHFLPYDHLP